MLRTLLTKPWQMYLNVRWNPIYVMSKYHFFTKKITSPSCAHILYRTESQSIRQDDLNESILTEISISNPSVCLHNRYTIKDTISMFSAFGFEPEDIKSFYVKVPELLNYKSTDLCNIIQTFKTIQIEEDLLNAHLLVHPQLFLLNPQIFKKRCAQLERCFPNKDITEVFINCPSAFSDEWQSIMKKIHFIMFVMGLDQKDVVYSNALGFSLEYIIHRYELVNRTGKFKRTKRKTKHLSKNIRLKELLNLSNQEICHFCGVSVEEYHILGRILEAEAKNEIAEDFDDLE